jgi:hypothetical protein
MANIDPQELVSRWEMIPSSGGEAAGAGLEILVLHASGRIKADYQFIEG